MKSVVATFPKVMSREEAADIAWRWLEEESGGSGYAANWFFMILGKETLLGIEMETK